MLTVQKWLKMNDISYGIHWVEKPYIQQCVILHGLNNISNNNKKIRNDIENQKLSTKCKCEAIKYLGYTGIDLLLGSSELK